MSVQVIENEINKESNNDNCRYKLSTFHKWFGLFLVALGGGTIYIVPYLLSTYITQIQAITGESTTNLQLLITVYGIISLIFYIPGGWIADRISTKTLFTFSMIGTGILSIWYSLIGFNGLIDFSQLVIIHALFAITTVLTFWSAFVKGVNLFGSKNEQAKLYSRTDLMRNIIGCIATFISVGLVGIIITNSVFNNNNGSGLFFVLIFYGIIYLLTGILCLFFMPGSWIQSSTKRNFDGLFEYRPIGQNKIIIASSKSELKPYKRANINHFWKQVYLDLVESLKNINMWLIAFLIFFTMNTYAAINNFGTYFSTNYGIDNQIASLMVSIYNYGTPILGALFFGWLATKNGSTSKTIIYSNIPLIIILVIMIVIVGTAKTLPQGNDNAIVIAGVGIVLLSLAMFFIGGNRAIYWSTMTETNIPLSIVGISSGLISIIGFSKDIWVGPAISEIMNSHLINNQPFSQYNNQAFVLLYTFALINAICALIFSYLIFQKIKFGKIFIKKQAITLVFKNMFSNGN